MFGCGKVVGSAAGVAVVYTAVPHAVKITRIKLIKKMVFMFRKVIFSFVFVNRYLIKQP